MVTRLQNEFELEDSPTVDELQRIVGGQATAAPPAVNLPTGWGVAGGLFDDPAEKIGWFNQNQITPEQILAADPGADIDWMRQYGYTIGAPAPAPAPFAPELNQYGYSQADWEAFGPEARSFIERPETANPSCNPRSLQRYRLPGCLTERTAVARWSHP